MSLAKRLHETRKRARLTLDEVAARAGISKTYYWELENDEKEIIKPSADIVMKLAKALSTTLADLLEMPTVQTDDHAIEIPSSLAQFRDERAKIDKALTSQEVRELAAMQFRGGQPKTSEGWNDVFLALDRNIKRKK